MRAMRQKIQLTLPSTWDSPGESGGAHPIFTIWRLNLKVGNNRS